MKAPTLAATSPACRNCHFYLADSPEIGWCRRYPPGAQLIQDDESGDWIPVPVHRPTPPDEWCGEWKADQ